MTHDAMQAAIDAFEIETKINSAGLEYGLSEAIKAYLSALRDGEATEGVEASLDERMEAAGMIPLSKLLAGDTPLARWEVHTSVRDLASFEQWLQMRHREIKSLRVKYELGDKDETDDLYEWVLAHDGAFSEVAANFRAALTRNAEPPVAATNPEAPAAGVVKELPAHGVVISTDGKGEETRVSVKEWMRNAGKPVRITFGIFLGNHRWAEAEITPEDAQTVAALILSKPSVAALVATPPAPTAAVDGEVMKALREALEYVRGIIVEGSLTGFNPLDGDWAERLYASQGLTHRALAALKAPAPEAVAPTGTVISDAMVERALNAYYGGDGGAIGHLRTDMRVALAAALSAPMGEGEALTIEAYYARQIDWSRNTFGPALRTRGVIDHIRKELAEIEADPHDLSEWVDVVILAMDGFWRHGGAVKDLMPRLLAKQQKNMARTWPDWRLMSEDTAIEHDRSGEGVRP